MLDYGWASELAFFLSTVYILNAFRLKSTPLVTSQ
jgi:hypothetical protein